MNTWLNILLCVICGVLFFICLVKLVKKSTEAFTSLCLLFGIVVFVLALVMGQREIMSIIAMPLVVLGIMFFAIKPTNLRHEWKG